MNLLRRKVYSINQSKKVKLDKVVQVEEEKVLPKKSTFKKLKRLLSKSKKVYFIDKEPDDELTISHEEVTDSSKQDLTEDFSETESVEGQETIAEKLTRRWSLSSDDTIEMVQLPQLQSPPPEQELSEKIKSLLKVEGVIETVENPLDFSPQSETVKGHGKFYEETIMRAKTTPTDTIMKAKSTPKLSIEQVPLRSTKSVADIPRKVNSINDILNDVESFLQELDPGYQRKGTGTLQRSKTISTTRQRHKSKLPDVDEYDTVMDYIDSFDQPAEPKMSLDSARPAMDQVPPSTSSTSWLWGAKKEPVQESSSLQERLKQRIAAQTMPRKLNISYSYQEVVKRKSLDIAPLFTSPGDELKPAKEDVSIGSGTQDDIKAATENGQEGNVGTQDDIKAATENGQEGNVGTQDDIKAATENGQEGSVGTQDDIKADSQEGSQKSNVKVDSASSDMQRIESKQSTNLESSSSSILEEIVANAESSSSSSEVDQVDPGKVTEEQVVCEPVVESALESVVPLEQTKEENVTTILSDDRNDSDLQDNAVEALDNTLSSETVVDLAVSETTDKQAAKEQRKGLRLFTGTDGAFAGVEDTVFSPKSIDKSQISQYFGSPVMNQSMPIPDEQEESSSEYSESEGSYADECDSECATDCSGNHEYETESYVSTTGAIVKEPEDELDEIMGHLERLNTQTLSNQRAETLDRGKRIERQLEPIYETLRNLDTSRFDPHTVNELYITLGSLKQQATTTVKEVPPPLNDVDDSNSHLKLSSPPPAKKKSMFKKIKKSLSLKKVFQ